MLACALSILQGCATGNTQAQTVSRQAETRQEASKTALPVVLGKFDLSRDGKPETLGLTWTGVKDCYAIVRADGASDAMVLGMDSDGRFSWPLKPGNYTMLGFSFSSGHGNESFKGVIDGRFSVTEGDAGVYIGNVELDIGETGRYSVAIRDREQAAMQDFQKRTPPIPAGTVKRLLTPEKPPGTFAHVRNVCAKDWRQACSKDLRGVAPLFPTLQHDMSGLGFTKIDTPQPTLRWQATLQPEISYDVAVWEAIPYRFPLGSTMYTRGPLVAYAQDVALPELHLDNALKSKTRYFWSVRLRRGDTVSSWSTAGHFTFLVVAWRSSRGESFGFETP